MSAATGVAAASRAAKQIQVHRTVDAFRAARKALDAGRKVGFVPTMGALHKGMHEAKLFQRHNVDVFRHSKRKFLRIQIDHFLTFLQYRYSAYRPFVLSRKGRG